MSLFCKINFFKPNPTPLPPNLMTSLVPLVHSIINFVIRFSETHLIKQNCRSNFRRLPRELPRQIQRFVPSRWQKNYQGTAEANNAFLASASAIVLLMAFELKFERCIINFTWFNPGDTVRYPGLSWGTPVLCKDLIYLYKNNTLWYI